LKVERLWSPWRLAYVTGTGGGASDPGCVFCGALEAPDSPESLVVHRGTTCFVILNLFPYNNGHLMVVPNRHVGKLADASAEELAELMSLTRVAEIVLTELYQPHGLNMGINLGRPAGAGVLDHLHMHVVPRWNGDTNFMTVVGSVRVLPEQLDQTATRMRPVFARMANAAP
jgi:ATP adenylyltransferase